jgi:hypothetical protein
LFQLVSIFLMCFRILMVSVTFADLGHGIHPSCNSRGQSSWPRIRIMYKTCLLPFVAPQDGGLSMSGVLLPSLPQPAHDDLHILETTQRLLQTTVPTMLLCLGRSVKDRMRKAICRHQELRSEPDQPFHPANSCLGASGATLAYTSGFNAGVPSSDIRCVGGASNSCVWCSWACTGACARLFFRHTSKPTKPMTTSAPRATPTPIPA